MKCVPSARLEEQNGHLAQVEVDKMLGLVSHIAAEVSPDDAVPGWVVLLIKLLLGDRNETCFSLLKCQNLVFEKKIKIAMHFKDIKAEITLFGTFGIQINVDTLIVSIAAVAQHLFNVTMYWARGEFRRCSRDVKADKTKQEDRGTLAELRLCPDRAVSLETVETIANSRLGV